ncbi:MAG: hypothetical protein H7835_09040 [Magnetococcus sp. XQGC-1]
MSYRICCAISGHGLGHAAQTAALVNHLAEELPDIQIHIVSPLPRTVLARLLRVDFSLDNRTQDVGLIQPDPMQVDLEATAVGLRLLHAHWSYHLAEEKKFLAEWQPDLLLANVPYLPIAAAAELGIPTLAIASLSWDAVLAAYFSRSDPEVEEWWQTMRQAYALTTLALLPTPAILDNLPFPQVERIAPLTPPGHRRREALRQSLGLAKEDERPLILVSLGGIPARHLPVHVLAQEERVHWLLDVPLPDHPGHLHSTPALLPHYSFADLSASVDGVVSKPGYGMATAATTQQIPFLYIRRGLFPDEPPICAWMEQMGRARELSADHFYSGNWYAPLRELLDQPAKPHPPANGIRMGVDIIMRQFSGNLHA